MLLAGNHFTVHSEAAFSNFSHERERERAWDQLNHLIRVVNKKPNAGETSLKLKYQENSFC